MAALRGVRPRWPWLAGSAWSYASTSTIRPPARSTSNVTPIRSGATSWTLRAKKLRRNTLARVVLDKCWKRECEHSTPDDAQKPARHDREAQTGRVRQRTGFEIADGRRGGNLHELDPGDAPEHLVRRDPVQHHGAQDRADLVAKPRDAETQKRNPELLREPEGNDGGAPEGGGDDDAEALAAHVAQRTREQRHGERPRRRRHVQITDQRRIAEVIARHRREQRRRHAEDHRVRIDEEEAEDHRLVPHVAKALLDGLPARPVRVLARHEPREQSDRNESADVRDGVGEVDPLQVDVLEEHAGQTGTSDGPEL